MNVETVSHRLYKDTNNKRRSPKGSPSVYLK